MSAAGKGVPREYEKMISGQLYSGLDPELTRMRHTARRLCDKINRVTTDLRGKDARLSLCRKLFGCVGKNLWIQPPFYCDYGRNIFLGDNVYMNFNCIILDVAPVTLGSNVFLGPNVQIYTATHPLVAEERNKGLESGKAITVHDNVWIGGSAVLCPGVTIGEGCVIGAGAVVTKNIPARVVVAGNPARVIKHLPAASQEVL